jgi:hypothetical protein
MRIRFCGKRIDLNSSDNGEPGFLEPLSQSAAAGEEIYRCTATLS